MLVDGVLLQGMADLGHLGYSRVWLHCAAANIAHEEPKMEIKDFINSDVSFALKFIDQVVLSSKKLPIASL